MAEGIDGLLRDKTRKPGKPSLPVATGDCRTIAIYECTF
jgi:hypothetical protein